MRSLHTFAACFVAALCFTAHIRSEVDLGLPSYEDLLMQDLYKRLASELDDGYIELQAGEYRPARDYETGSPADFQEGQGHGHSGASIRDSEYIQHSSNAGSQGFIHMSGGAGEGQQHLTPDGSIDNIKPGAMPPVKSDESLPFYCHPTNPCPKGMTSENGCQEDVEDTAEAQKEWISQMQRHGFCTCDHEHMFDCPDTQILPEKQTPHTDDQAFKEVMDKILADKASATYMSGEKRLNVVAKKSPRLKRSPSSNKLEEDLKQVHESAKKSNPYLAGERLRTVAKKG